MAYRASPCAAPWANLQREHLIERRRSAGTRVVYRPPPARMIADISGVLANLADMGRSTKVQLLSFGYVQASGAGRRGARRRRRMNCCSARSASARSTVCRFPICWRMCRNASASRSRARNWPTGRCSNCWNASGVKVERATQRISAALAAPDVARALGVETGSPLIELVRTVYDRDGRGVEHLHALYRPDRYSFEFDLVRSGDGQKTELVALRRLRARKPTQRSKSRGQALPFI